MIHVLAVLFQNWILPILQGGPFLLFHHRRVGGGPGLRDLAGRQGRDAPEKVVLGCRPQESRKVLC